MLYVVKALCMMPLQVFSLNLFADIFPQISQTTSKALSWSLDNNLYDECRITDMRAIVADYRRS